MAQLGISLITMLSNPAVITSIILLTMGLVLSILSLRITMSVRKTDEVSGDDKLLLTLKTLGLLFIIMGLLFVIYGSIY